MRACAVSHTCILRFCGTFFFCVEGDTERTDRAQEQADFSPCLALLHVHDPLSAHTNFLCQRLLVEAKLSSVVTDKSPDIGRRSNAHVFPCPTRCQRTVTLCHQSQRAATIQKVSGRRHSEMSANGDTHTNNSKDKGKEGDRERVMARNCGTLCVATLGFFARNAHPARRSSVRNEGT